MTLLFQLITKNPLAMAIIAGLMIAIPTGTYFYGKSEGYDNGFNKAENNCLQAKQQAVARAIEETNRINQENAEISQAYWEQKLQDQPKIQAIEERIIEYVEVTRPGHCDLDDGELHILTDLTDLVNGSAKTAN